MKISVHTHTQLFFLVRSPWVEVNQVPGTVNQWTNENQCTHTQTFFFGKVPIRKRASLELYYLPTELESIINVCCYSFRTSNVKFTVDAEIKLNMHFISSFQIYETGKRMRLVGNESGG